MSDLLPSPRVKIPPALIDTRIIEFGQKTIVTALESVGVKLLSLPAGARVSNIELDPAHNGVKVFYLGGTSRTVDDNHLAVLMIAYCIAARLPISRSADKAVKVTERGVTLRFTTTLALPPRVQ